MKRLLSLLGVLALILLGVGLGLLYPIVVRPPLVLNQDAAVAGVADVPAAFNSEAGGFIDIGPADAATLLILYPGGLVRPQAYQWLGTALAVEGVRTLIPVFPFDLAVIASGRAGGVLEWLGAQGRQYERVVLAGHSLGGVMAARFVRDNPERVDALILMAAYSAEGDDLSGLDIRVLDLAAEFDGLATLEQVRAGLARLPAETELIVIPGAVHSFFGRYGPQRGDGQPTVSRAEAEAGIVTALRMFLASLDTGLTPEAAQD